MKLYWLDMGWEGAAMTIAPDLETAKAQMLAGHPRGISDRLLASIEEVPIENGQTRASIGDG